MNKAPNIYSLREIFHCMDNGPKVNIYGEWVSARALGYFSLPHRMKCAWLAFTGQADVLIWPEDERKS